MSKTARTKYAVYAVEYRQGHILLNLSQANRIIETQLYRRYFAFLGKRTTVVREAKFDGYKCDLYIKDSNTIIEIKCLLAFDRIATFPTVFPKEQSHSLRQSQTCWIRATRSAMCWYRSTRKSERLDSTPA